MSPKAPTRLDRALLTCVTGTLGQLVGTVLEVAAILREQRRSRRRVR